MPATSVPRIEPIKGFDGVTLDIEFYLKAAYEDMTDAQQEIPAVMEWLNELRQSYEEEEELLGGQIKEAEAKAYFDLRGNGEGNYQANYQCKPTEDGLKMAIALDPEVRRLKERMAGTIAMRKRLTGTIGSLQAKVDLLRSSEATRRSTFDDTTPRRRE